MLEYVTRNWWVVAVRGLCALLFGVLTVVWPQVTVGTIVMLFGIYALADGALALVTLFGPARAPRRWALALHAVVSVAAGVIAFTRPESTALALIYALAAWAILTGILTILAAVELRKEIANEWLLGTCGGVAVALGVALAAYPTTGTLVLLALIAAYAIVAGVLQLTLGLRLRRLRPAEAPAAASTTRL